MKLLCFVDSLNSGGAQRQLTTLAVCFKKRGYDVRFLVYHPHDHFLPLLHEAGIPCQVISPCWHWRRLLEVRRVLRQGWQDVVLTFLEAPCWYAELARLPRQRWGLVAGERSANPGIRAGAGRWLRQGHRLADLVVANSHTNRLLLHHEWPFLRNKLTTIYNTVDLQHFRPAWEEGDGRQPGTEPVCRIVVAARYDENKNMIGVGKALLELKRGKCPRSFVVDWYGGMPADPSAYNRAQGFIAENGLTGILNLHQPTRRVGAEYAAASAVGLFSFFEGLPNVICEAMACGKPILLSAVCDAGSLVREGQNGFLCDPAAPESIANAIRQMVSLNAQERRHMGAESRRMAEALFDEGSVLGRYEQVLDAAARRKPVPADSAWPTQVPESAVRTAAQWANGGSRQAW